MGGSPPSAAHRRPAVAAPRLCTAPHERHGRERPPRCSRQSLHLTEFAHRPLQFGCFACEHSGDSDRGSPSHKPRPPRSPREVMATSQPTLRPLAQLGHRLASLLAEAADGEHDSSRVARAACVADTGPDGASHSERSRSFDIDRRWVMIAHFLLFRLARRFFGVCSLFSAALAGAGRFRRRFFFSLFFRLASALSFFFFALGRGFGFAGRRRLSLRSSALSPSAPTAEGALARPSILTTSGGGGGLLCGHPVSTRQAGDQHQQQPRTAGRTAAIPARRGRKPNRCRVGTRLECPRTGFRRPVVAGSRLEYVQEGEPGGRGWLSAGRQ